ncbi:MAG: DUF2127 domain-containing protein [Acidimicrobiia bacterium]|nr:DUF2127 domain-containing protein [Acidimicrobiia bacterium]
MLLFGLMGIAALIARFELGFLQGWAQDLLTDLQTAVNQTARAASHTWIQDGLTHLADLAPGTLFVLIAVSFAYATIEGVEAVGLWRGRRWAEYLTVLVTASLLPIELRELAEGVSPFRVAALLLNLAILVYLVWAKRLFGLRGGAPAAEEHTDWEAVLASPVTEGASIRIDTDPTELVEPGPTVER